MDTPTHIVTVLTPDRPGIVHALAARLAEADVPHLAISQTVVHGAFTIALVLAVPDSTDPEALAGALARAAGERATASLLALDGAGDGVAAGTDAYVLTAIGRAGSGIVSDLTRTVLEHAGSFTDFSSQSVDGSVQLIAEVELPPGQDLAALQDALASVAQGRELTVRLQHRRLFAATNEVAFRRLERGAERRGGSRTDPGAERRTGA